MKTLICMFVLIMLVSGAYAACASGWEEIPMENVELTTDATCPINTGAYYSFDNVCDSNVM